jgi:hypothetical protein
MSTKTIQVIRCADRSHAAAVLNTSLAAAEFAMAETTWGGERQRIRMELMERQAPPAEWPESLHWDWIAKASLLRRLEVTGAGIVVEGSWEGLMLTKSASYLTRSGPDRNKPILYVDYIEVAPWNWSIAILGQRPRYRGVGSLLLAEAVRQSFAEGFHGRLALHSLPQAEGFYRKALRMTPLERDEDKQNLLYLELSRENARLLLEKGPSHE